MSRGSRPKQRAALQIPYVALLALVALVLIGGSLVWTWTYQEEKQSRSLYDDMCLLYTYDVFTKLYENEPAYPCIFSCPGVPIRGYCPEEQAIRLILYSKIFEANAGDTLSLALQAERALSSIVSLYIAILTGNSERAEILRNARIAEKNLEVNMVRAAEILQKFIEKGDLKTLEMLYTVVEVK